MSSIKIEAGSFTPQRAYLRTGKLQISLTGLKMAVYELRSAVHKISLDQQIGKTIYFTLDLFDGKTIKGQASEKDYQLLYTEFRKGPMWGSRPYREKSLLPYMVLALLVFSPVFYVLYMGKPGVQTGRSSYSLERTIVSTNYGCKNEAEFDRIVRLHAQGDETASKNSLNMLTSNGACTVFNSGERVYIAATGIFKVKVRREGENDTYWTFLEAVSR